MILKNESRLNKELESCLGNKTCCVTNLKGGKKQWV